MNDSSWSYNNVLPYFKKSENFTRSNPYASIDTAYHGHEGPLHVTQCIPPQNISASILKGMQQIGYKIHDSNGKEQLGGSIFQYYIYEGKRFNPEMAFITPAKKRRNLVVLDKSFVTKIQICKETKIVKGVIFTRKNRKYIARIYKEVILSAGAISSPQLLMLSGIGPKDHLKTFGIPIIQNLPVGKTMRDHALVPLVFSINVSLVENLNKSVDDFLNAQGSLTRPMLVDAVGWFRSSLERNKNYPDLQIIFNNISNSELIRKFFGWSEETYSLLDPHIPNLVALEVILLHSVSNGSVELTSSSPFEYPKIDPNILSENRDMDTLYDGIQLAIKLTETDSFRSMNFTPVFNRFPGCDHLKFLSKEYWFCYIRRVTAIGSHQVGTCLTSLDSNSGVVDAKLKVFGVKGLRVADASVIPITVRGNTNAAVTMVAEKISDVIKNQYKKYTGVFLTFIKKDFSENVFHIYTKEYDIYEGCIDE